MIQYIRSMWGKSRTPAEKSALIFTTMTDINPTAKPIKARSHCKSDEEYLNQFSIEVLKEALIVLEAISNAQGTQTESSNRTGESRPSESAEPSKSSH